MHPEFKRQMEGLQDAHKNADKYRRENEETAQRHRMQDSRYEASPKHGQNALIFLFAIIGFAAVFALLFR
jgi:hypothetical protein